MNAESILQKTHKLGIKLVLAGDRIRYAPKLKTPPDLVEELRRHKADIISHLQRQMGTESTTYSQVLHDSATEENSRSVPPIIRETDNDKQIRSLLVLRQAELVVAETHLTGIPECDWYVKNSISDLEIKIAALRRRLAEDR